MFGPKGFESKKAAGSSKGWAQKFGSLSFLPKLKEAAANGATFWCLVLLKVSTGKILIQYELFVLSQCGNSLAAASLPNFSGARSLNAPADRQPL